MLQKKNEQKYGAIGVLERGITNLNNLLRVDFTI